MSGVVKDESQTKPEAETEETGTKVADNSANEPGAEVAMSADDTDTQIRKSAPHLRVVSGSEDEATEAIEADAVEAVADADAALSEITPLVEQEVAPDLPPLFPEINRGEGEEEIEEEPDDGEPQVRIGAAIREQREAQNLTVEEVSKELRLHVSVLRAIEDMNAAALGPRVYAIGHIRDYARHLGMEPGKTVARYKAECAILADPVRKDITPPKTERKVASAAPVLGALVGALAIAGGAFYLFSGSDEGGGAEPSTTASVAVPAASEMGGSAAGAPTLAAPAQTLRIVANRRARVEFRGADGTKFLARYFSPGESYAPRVGAGWTVTTTEGDAFEWRLGDMTLGQLSEDGGPVYAQSVDAALSREAKPIEVAEQPVAEFAPGAAPEPEPTPPATSRDEPAPRPAPARTRAPASVAVEPPAEAAPEEVDPSLLAYPE